jgi:hypothetical protein
VTLGPVIVVAMAGNCHLESICSERVRLKTEERFFKNVGAFHPTGTTHYQSIVALRIFLRATKLNPLSAKTSA